MADVLQDLIDSTPHLWRGRHCTAAGEGLATGFAGLDRVLPGGGWPWGCVIELLVPAMGIGELRLLLPAMARLTRARRQVLMIDAPYQPYAPALSAAGVDLEHLLIIAPERRTDAWWSAEKALACSLCGMVLLWQRQDDRSGAGTRLDPQAVRRLQVAAQTGRSLLFLYRCIGFRTAVIGHQHSWAAVRLALSAAGADRLEVEVLRARGGCAQARIVIDCERR